MPIHGSYTYSGQMYRTYDGKLGLLIPTLMPEVGDALLQYSPTLRAFKATKAYKTERGYFELEYRVRYRSGASSVGGQASGLASIRFGGDPYNVNVSLSDGSTQTGAGYPAVRVFSVFSLPQPDIDKRKYNPDALGDYVLDELKGWAEDLGRRTNDVLWRVQNGEGITVAATGFGNPGTRDNLGSIPYYVSDCLNHSSETPASWNATTTAQLGGIDGSTQTWWRSFYQNGGSGSGGALTFKDLSKAYILLEATTGEPPNLIIVHPDVYAKIEDLFITQARVMFGKEAAPEVTGGFSGLSWRNALIIADTRVPSGTQSGRYRIYMLNTRHLELVIGLEPEPVEVPVLMDARAWKMTADMQLGMRLRNRHFVFDNIVV